MLSRLRKNLSTMSDVAEDIPRILLRVPIDGLAAATGRCRRTVTNWLNGSTAPSAADLIMAMSHYDDVTNEILKLAGKRSLTDDQINKLRRVLEDL